MDQDFKKQDLRSNVYTDAHAGWGCQRSLQVTMDHNTTTTGQSFHACVTIIYVKKYTV